MPIEEWQRQAFTAREVDDSKASIDRERRELPQLKSGARLPWALARQFAIARHQLREAGGPSCPILGAQVDTVPRHHYSARRIAAQRKFAGTLHPGKICFRKTAYQIAALELCFDDLREDGLRDEFGALLQDGERESLSDEPVARGIIDLVEAEWKHVDPHDENPGRDGFVQKGLGRPTRFSAGSRVAVMGEAAAPAGEAAHRHLLPA